MADNTEKPGKGKPTRTQAGAIPAAAAVPEGSILSADALIPGGGGGVLASRPMSPANSPRSRPASATSWPRSAVVSPIRRARSTVAWSAPRPPCRRPTITVVTDVVQELNDDGLPVPTATQLVTQNVSLINFVRPTAHQWSHVALRMDMTVGAVDNERGITVTSKSDSTRGRPTWACSSASSASACPRSRATRPSARRSRTSSPTGPRAGW